MCLYPFLFPKPKKRAAAEFFVSATAPRRLFRQGIHRFDDGVGGDGRAGEHVHIVNGEGLADELVQEGLVRAAAGTEGGGLIGGVHRDGSDHAVLHGQGHGHVAHHALDGGGADLVPLGLFGGFRLGPGRSLDIIADGLGGCLAAVKLVQGFDDSLAFIGYIGNEGSVHVLHEGAFPADELIQERAVGFGGKSGGHGSNGAVGVQRDEQIVVERVGVAGEEPGFGAILGGDLLHGLDDGFIPFIFGNAEPVGDFHLAVVDEIDGLIGENNDVEGRRLDGPDTTAQGIADADILVVHRAGAFDGGAVVQRSCTAGTSGGHVVVAVGAAAAGAQQTVAAGVGGVLLAGIEAQAGIHGLQVDGLGPDEEAELVKGIRLQIKAMQQRRQMMEPQHEIGHIGLLMVDEEVVDHHVDAFLHAVI